MKSTIREDNQWTELQLKYRLELLFGKARSHEQPLDDYLNYLDLMNLDVPFSFNSLILIRYQFPVLKELIFPGNKSQMWPLLDQETDETIVFMDPLLKGNKAVFFCHVAQSEDETRDVINHWKKWGEGRQGMIVSDSPASSQRTVVAVPGSWFAVK